MKRLIYFFYYLKKLDVKKYRKFLQFVKAKTGKSGIQIHLDVISNSFKYNISILEYFMFHFYQLSEQKKSEYAGTGYMYEYQLMMNPPAHRPALSDKRKFLKRFAPFVIHRHATKEELQTESQKSLELLQNSSGKLVLKNHDGQCGVGVQVIKISDLKGKSLPKLMEELNLDLAEEYIEQHPSLMELSPSGLNTVRIFTQLTTENYVEIIGCRLRISINSVVDNLAAGNIAAPIDDVTGIITGPGVYSDITKEDETFHPVTGVQIIGFQVPYWKETIQLVQDAAKAIPECKSIGWDIAITKNGPELLEGNHDWCKLVWQLPVKNGLKVILERYKKKHLV